MGSQKSLQALKNSCLRPCGIKAGALAQSQCSVAWACLGSTHMWHISVPMPEYLRRVNSSHEPCPGFDTYRGIQESSNFVWLWVCFPTSPSVTFWKFISAQIRSHPTMTTLGWEAPRFSSPPLLPLFLAKPPFWKCSC